MTRDGAVFDYFGGIGDLRAGRVRFGERGQGAARHQRLGEIAIAGVEGFVIDGGAQTLPVVLLGMSFLRHVDLQRSGTTLTLTRRH